MKSFESVFILGGTSTIARAICIKLAETGVKRISIGTLTHSINSLDLKLEI